MARFSWNPRNEGRSFTFVSGSQNALREAAETVLLAESLPQRLKPRNTPSTYRSAEALRQPEAAIRMEFFRNLQVHESLPAAGADFSASFHRFEFRFGLPHSMGRGHS